MGVNVWAGYRCSIGFFCVLYGRVELRALHDGTTRLSPLAVFLFVPFVSTVSNFTTKNDEDEGQKQQWSNKRN